MYAIEHEGKAYTPDGVITCADVTEHNAAIEEQEIAWLKTGPRQVMLYVREPKEGQDWAITTWLGAVVSEHPWVGSVRSFRVPGSHWPSKRRPVTCRIFGTLYHGWYFESSGDYCRLKRAKRQ